MPAFRVANRSTLLPGLALLTALVLVLLIGATLNPGEARAKGLIASTKACPTSPANSSNSGLEQARRTMTCLVNFARRKRGLWHLKHRSKLSWSARKKARDIRRCGFAHSACGRQFDFWIRRSGYLGRSGWATAENIGWGGGNLGGVRAIFIAWMQSRGHRSAILSRAYSDVGVGMVKGRFQGVPGAGIWVLHLARN